MTLRWLAATLTALAALLASSGVTPAEAARSDHRALRVMTWNLYLGADLRPALDPRNNMQAFLDAVARIYAESRDTDFGARAEAIADEIETKDPDLVGLQEVSRWETSEPTEPDEDFLAVLKDELTARGLNYAVASVSDNATIGPVPLSPCGSTQVCQLSFSDRDVVLVNEETRRLSWWNPQHGNFARQFRFTPPLEGATPVSFNRGWASIDGQFRGRRFHFVTTHLETAGSSELVAVQQAQAAELLAGPAFGPGADLVVGDINSAPDDSTSASYDLLTGQLRDAWSVRRKQPGYTCCQAPTLDNPTSQLTRRIDVILVRGARPVRARVVGNVPFADTPPLWPSDHAGVVADLLLRSDRVGSPLS